MSTPCDRGTHSTISIRLGVQWSVENLAFSSLAFRRIISIRTMPSLFSGYRASSGGGRLDRKLIYGAELRREQNGKQA